MSRHMKLYRGLLCQCDQYWQADRLQYLVGRYTEMKCGLAKVAKSSWSDSSISAVLFLLLQLAQTNEGVAQDMTRNSDAEFGMRARQGHRNTENIVDIDRYPNELSNGIYLYCLYIIV